MDFKDILKQENKKYIVTLVLVSLLFFGLYIFQKVVDYQISEDLKKVSILFQYLSIITTLALLVYAYNKFEKVAKEQKKIENNTSEKEKIYISTRKYQHTLIQIALILNFVNLAIFGSDFFMYLFCMSGIFALMTFFSVDSFNSNFTTTYDSEEDHQ